MLAFSGAHVPLSLRAEAALRFYSVDTRTTARERLTTTARCGQPSRGCTVKVASNSDSVHGAAGTDHPGSRSDAAWSPGLLLESEVSRWAGVKAHCASRSHGVPGHAASPEFHATQGTELLRPPTVGDMWRASCGSKRERRGAGTSTRRQGRSGARQLHSG